MSASVEFLLRLFEQGRPPQVAQEDFEGEHAGSLRVWQQAGFLAREPGVHAAPSCPRCGEGVPYRLGERHVCNRCHSDVDPAHLRCWGLDLAAFLGWLGRRLGLRGGVRRLEEHLWHLGVWGKGEEVHECFYRGPGTLSERGQARLAAYRNVLLFHGLDRPPEAGRLCVRCLSLLQVVRLGRSVVVTSLRSLLKAGGAVSFDTHSGALWAGDSRLGEVPPGSREYHFLRCLVGHLDRFVPYSDLKRFVLEHSGCADTAPEATFCHDLKRRIKKKWIPRIDRLLATTNKGDGYRLRGRSEA